MNEIIVLFALVQQLGSPSYAQRETAQALVQKSLSLHMGENYVCLTVLKQGVKGKDQEIAKRCAAILDKHHQIQRYPEPVGKPLVITDFPCIDLLPPTVFKNWGGGNFCYDRCLFIQRAKAEWKGTTGAPDWNEYRYATYLFGLQLVNDGWVGSNYCLTEQREAAFELERNARLFCGE